FFIPDGKDGKYRMQVFALEDQRDGKILLYLPDVVADAIKGGVLGKPAPARRAEVDASAFFAVGPAPAEHLAYPIRAHKGEFLEIEALDSTNTPDPPAPVTHMLGWNRKALRVTLPTVAATHPATAA